MNRKGIISFRVAAVEDIEKRKPLTAGRHSAMVPCITVFQASNVTPGITVFVFRVPTEVVLS